MNCLIDDLMNDSGVQFGTSGARGLATAMTDAVCHGYTAGFLSYLRQQGAWRPGTPVGIGGDRRPSTGRIMAACARAVADLGGRPLDLGRIPSPAVAAWGIARGVPTLMVTGSHIPDDRNGIKFNLPTGEILKADEEGIRAQRIERPDALFDASGALSAAAGPAIHFPADPSAARDYVARYLDFFPADGLAGLRIGVYGHSSVAREPLAEVLAGLGARVTRLGDSETFLPVDTEAIRPEDVALARDWAAGGGFDALVSADGDGDRPLLSDEHGEWLRGDLLGILAARSLGAVGVVTPVSSNTAAERCGQFARVLRTRIGSPFVIAGMTQLLAEGLAPVVGYEANGGFLLASDLVRPDGRRLPALPTRDALLPILAVLETAAARGRPVSALAGELPRRHTHSDRIKNYPTARSLARLAALTGGDAAGNRAAVEALLGGLLGPVAALDATDGLRIAGVNGEIAHLRPSGNAPELRAYGEADTPTRAAEIVARCLERWQSAPDAVPTAGALKDG